MTKCFPIHEGPCLCACMSVPGHEAAGEGNESQAIACCLFAQSGALGRGSAANHSQPNSSQAYLQEHGQSEAVADCGDNKEHASKSIALNN